jgi:hypothetical protein
MITTPKEKRGYKISHIRNEQEGILPLERRRLLASVSLNKAIERFIKVESTQLNDNDNLSSDSNLLNTHEGLGIEILHQAAQFLSFLSKRNDNLGIKIAGWISDAYSTDEVLILRYLHDETTPGYRNQSETRFLNLHQNILTHLLSLVVSFDGLEENVKLFMNIDSNEAGYLHRMGFVINPHISKDEGYNNMFECTISTADLLSDKNLCYVINIFLDSINFHS